MQLKRTAPTEVIHSRNFLVLVAVFAVAALVASVFAFLSLHRWADGASPVPDHATVFSGTQPMLFAGTVTLAQRFQPRRDGLSAIDVALAAEEPNLTGVARLEVIDRRTDEVLRDARVAAASIPAGSAWTLKPGQPGERWTTFGFEPVADSAGRELLFRLTYADGLDRPGTRLATLAHFPGTYPLNDILVNGFPQNGNLLFRLAASGRRIDAVQVALDNVARNQPVGRGTLALPLGLAGLCALFASSTVWLVVHPVSHADRVR